MRHGSPQPTVSKLVRAGVSDDDIMRASSISLEILGGYYYLSKGSRREKMEIQELEQQNRDN